MAGTWTETFFFSREGHFGFETFANVLSDSVSENLVSVKKSRYRFHKIWSRFRFRKIWYRKKVSASVLENLVWEKSFSFGKFGLEKSLGFGFGKLGLGKEKIKVTRKNLDQVNSPSLYLNSNLFCFVPIY